MIDIKDLNLNKDFYIKKFSDKGFDLKSQINSLLKDYQFYLKSLSIEEQNRFSLNKISKEILKNPNLKKDATLLSEKIKKNTLNTKNLLDKINSILATFPNPAFDNVIIGKNENSNKILNVYNEKYKLKKSKAHFEILKNKNLTLDNEAIFLSGSRQVIYQNDAAKIILALKNFLIEHNLSFGYKLVETPVIVNEKMLYNTAQLPKFKDDLFMLENGQYLIPTGEVPLTNLVSGKIIDKKLFPIKYVAFTECFRKEVGSAGKDTRGIIRLHQFRKVEIVKIGLKENFESDFEEMFNVIKLLLDKFKIAYRTVELCTGDLSFASKKTIDFEIWMPGLNRYLEISSLSIIGDFQARRMNTKSIDPKTKIKEFVYTYNGSSLAIDRLFAAIVENYYKQDNKISVPEVLQKYLSFKDF